MQILVDYTIPSGKKLNSGKVREIFAVDDEHLLIVTTDRISAFDVVLPDPIPLKGHVLNQLSLFWFEKATPLIKNHIVTSDVNEYPAPFTGDDRLKGRSILVKKARPLPVECIVRGYISGSGWKEYQQYGTISGIELPEGLVQSQKLPEPIFTPSTKAELGEHDENIDLRKAADLVGKDLIDKVRSVSLAIYTMASELALEKGIIIADTKFEFGIIDDELIIIDEALTPDSSRFWPRQGYEPGGPQPSFDKQFVRDYLETLDWNKTAPGPNLPEEIIKKTSEKYVAAYELLTGKKLPAD
ncbi:MAG TPA: phosphoribosylaminoimidazolesuccinocarboxamide synthase [Deltaproteobacteria bacterium]|nr:phosphoribosylaminoimidazolesuccinocarboxamide synthase [Deltaproteobacteria bacterium]HPJ94442.1 phosphoribosylaminoimidazolesuccinocarboxamide synthase [Deltaproteobacteria bacterium]HPR52419.1 phosphoribosylaminoimidazolesuccinocarboxamide synthase [Deltaproteobacteria bacterium]